MNVTVPWRSRCEQRVPHLLDVYDGDHRAQVAGRLERIVLPWIGERLETTASTASP